jgi:hypothetical protein
VFEHVAVSPEKSTSAWQTSFGCLTIVLLIWEQGLAIDVNSDQLEDSD